MISISALRVDPKLADRCYGRGLARLKNGDKPARIRYFRGKDDPGRIGDGFLRYGVRDTRTKPK